MGQVELNQEEMREIEGRIASIAERYRVGLQNRIQERKQEMMMDDNSHYMLYNVLGISNELGAATDFYQNVGRFLYKYAGAFVEDVIIECFKYKYPGTQSKIKIPNTVSTNPKKVEIDCLVGNCAIEIKWRDATTDGDHIKKEHVRLKTIRKAGFTPIRLMLYVPNRDQAIQIQKRLHSLYLEQDGQYYAGENAWEFIKYNTGVDLKSILQKLAISK